MKAREIIRRPLLTEKTTLMQERENTVCFEVDRRANKIQVRKAVEELFDVSVQKVRTIAMHGKVKRLGRFEGKRASWKKAIVTVAEGQKIDIYEAV